MNRAADREYRRRSGRPSSVGEDSCAVGDGTVTETGPGCRVEAPAGWLHRNLAGPTQRIVECTNLRG